MPPSIFNDRRRPHNLTVIRVILVAVATLSGLYLLWMIRSVLTLIGIAIFLAVALGPVVDFLQNRRLPRPLAIVLVYLGLMGAMAGAGTLLVPPVAEGVNQFVTDVPGYVEDIRESEKLRRYDDKYHFTEKLQQKAEALPEKLGGALAALQSVTLGVFSAIFQLLTVLVLTFFLLLDGRRIVEFGYSNLGRDGGRRARRLAHEMYGAVGGYVAGAGALGFTAGLSSYIVMKAAGVPFAAPLAVMMGLMDLVPLVGASIAGAVIGIVALLASPGAALAWLIFFLIYQQLENNVLQPYVYRRTVALHPLVVLPGVLIGATLLGILGALLAIPVAASIQILLKDWWEHRQQASLEGGEEDGPWEAKVIHNQAATNSTLPILQAAAEREEQEEQELKQQTDPDDSASQR